MFKHNWDSEWIYHDAYKKGLLILFDKVSEQTFRIVFIFDQKTKKRAEISKTIVSKHSRIRLTKSHRSGAFFSVCFWRYTLIKFLFEMMATLFRFFFFSLIYLIEFEKFRIFNLIETKHDRLYYFSLDIIFFTYVWTVWTKT